MKKNNFFIKHNYKSLDEKELKKTLKKKIDFYIKYKIKGSGL
jgi:hypothetical protein